MWSPSFPSCSSLFIHRQMWGHLVHQPLPRLVSQLPPCHESSLPRLPVTTPPTGLDECSFNFLVVGLPYSSIFWHFLLFFVFKFVVVLLLVVRGGKVYLPMPPSWPEVQFYNFLYGSFKDIVTCLFYLYCYVCISHTITYHVFIFSPYLKS